MRFNVVMIVPTGLGCSIGGHAGDATPAARLLGSVCDTLILHPNVVNASEINEAPENSLYVEGSVLNRFLEGNCALVPVRMNRIMVAVNEMTPMVRNAVFASCFTLGTQVQIEVLRHRLTMIHAYASDDGRATGEVIGLPEASIQFGARQDFDALAVYTPVEVPPSVALEYLRVGGVNPWGGVEATVSGYLGSALNKPVAHAPYFAPDDPLQTFNEVVDHRMGAEMISDACLFCVLKGLHRAPRICLIPGPPGAFNSRDVHCLVSPFGCWGPPHEACRDAGIPIIVVHQNTCAVQCDVPGGRTIGVENYLEAAGYLAAMRAGINPSSVVRST